VSDEVEAYLASRSGEGWFRGAAWRVESDRSVRTAGAVGEAEPATPFDLASLTKPLATALLALLLEEEGKLDLRERASSLLPELDGSAYDDVALLDLGCHTSGLPAWRPLYLWGRDLPAFLAAIAREEPAGPRGAPLYSDLGYILLGAALERAGGMPLDRMFDARVARPLGIRLGFAGSRHPFDDAAPTEEGNAHERQLAAEEGRAYAWRTEFRPGVVHDENARVLGGIAGHAGLFGAADAVAAVAREMLRPRSLPLGAEQRDLLLRPQAGRGGRSFGLMAAADSDTLRGVLPPEAVGHFGFTGTSLWMEPAAGRIFVLLANRVRPAPDSDDIRGLRRRFHALAAALPEW
jgi:CubicO group peptidase (beta-lactamase class C family)